MNRSELPEHSGMARKSLKYWFCVTFRRSGQRLGPVDLIRLSGSTGFLGISCGGMEEDSAVNVSEYSTYGFGAGC